jgi:hypothetical protein
MSLFFFILLPTIDVQINEKKQSYRNSSGGPPIGVDFRFVSLSKGVQGPPCRGLGCPQNLFSLRLPPLAAGEEKERVTRGHHLKPRQGAAAPWNPA